MSNLSVDYDGQPCPTQTSPLSTPRDAVIALYQGAFPETLIKVAPLTQSYRDAVIGEALNNPGAANELLSTITRKLRSIVDSSSQECAVVAEFCAAVAYGFGEQELAKKALLRVSPGAATSFGKTLANAFSGLKVPSDQFSSMLLDARTEANNNWNAQANTIMSLI